MLLDVPLFRTMKSEHGRPRQNRFDGRDARSHSPSRRVGRVREYCDELPLRVGSPRQ